MIRRRKPIQRSTTPIARSKRPRKVNPKRKASEFARCYGSKARVEWVKQQRCVGCWGLLQSLPCENAHVGNGGAGRKSGYAKVVPLCPTCHIELHNNGRRIFEDIWRVDLDREAALTQEAWLAFSGSDDA